VVKITIKPEDYDGSKKPKLKVIKGGKIDEQEKNKMELKDFVKETLSQIIEGIAAAQEVAKESGGQVNPAGVGKTMSKAGAYYYMEGGTEVVVETVEFDIVVSATEGESARGGAGIFVGGLGVGAQGQADSSQQSTNRIKFVVPITLPKG